MSKASELVRWATAQLGTAEEPRGSNNVRYNTLYYGREVSGGGYPWCMAFVWAGFREIGAGALFMDGGRTASCTALMRWAKAHGQWVTEDFRAGDVFLLQLDADELSDHTGIYTGRTEGGQYRLIEGNAADTVKSVLRPRTQVMGAYRARWEEESAQTAAGESAGSAAGSGTARTGGSTRDPGMGQCTAILPVLRQGDTGTAVRSLQRLLIAAGYSCGKCGIDGDFGPDTAAALARFAASRPTGDGAGRVGTDAADAVLWQSLITGA